MALYISSRKWNPSVLENNAREDDPVKFYIMYIKSRDCALYFQKKRTCGGSDEAEEELSMRPAISLGRRQWCAEKLPYWTISPSLAYCQRAEMCGADIATAKYLRRDWTIAKLPR